MTTNRVLNTEELHYISLQHKKTQKQLLGLLFLFVAIVSIAAIAVYTSKIPNQTVVNIIFGILIALIGVLHWIFKGYKKHKLNPIVHKSRGYYKRTYERRGKYGTYFDTINGVKVKLPWHWRSYIKKQKDDFSYEYIIRDGAVAMNEHPIYIISINDTLSLDYELNNGLKKTKSITLLNILSLFSLLPISVMILALGLNINEALKIRHALKTPDKHTVILHGVEALPAVKTSNYIKIENAWVYQYKKMSDLYGENYILTQDERDRIYIHPASDIDYRYFINSNYITKPDKETLKKQLKNNPLSKNTLLKSTDTSVVNNAIEKVYQQQLIDYNSRVKGLKTVEKQLEALKPKTFILKINDDVFNAPIESLYSIRKSLENPYTIHGFYIPSENDIISLEQQAVHNQAIKSAFILTSICGLLLLIAVVSFIKIIRNSRIKLRLLKEQLTANNNKRLN